MARLIDAKALEKQIKESIEDTNPVLMGQMLRWVRKQTTIDAVPVVRCKDCKHSIWDEENEMWKCVELADYDEDSGEWFGFCEYHNGDFFCADGERKDNG